MTEARVEHRATPDEKGSAAKVAISSTASSSTGSSAPASNSSKLRPTAKEFVFNTAAPVWTPPVHVAASPMRSAPVIAAPATVASPSPVKKSALKLSAKPFVPSFMAPTFVPAAVKVVAPAAPGATVSVEKNVSVETAASTVVTTTTTTTTTTTVATTETEAVAHSDEKSASISEVVTATTSSTTATSAASSNASEPEAEERMEANAEHQQQQETTQSTTKSEQDQAHTETIEQQEDQTQDETHTEESEHIEEQTQEVAVKAEGVIATEAIPSVKPETVTVADAAAQQEATTVEEQEPAKVVAEQTVIGERIMYTIKQLLEMEPEVENCPIPASVKGMVVAADKTTKALSAPAPEAPAKSMRNGVSRHDSSRSLGRQGSSGNFSEGRGRRGGGGGRGGRGGRGGGRGYNHHDTAPALEDCVPLEINEETRWKPTFAKSRLDEPVETSEASLKEAKSILNKLSIEKFDKLSDQLIEVAVRGLDVLKGVIEMVIAKAQMEWHFSTMYAELCAKIAQTDMPGITIDENEVVKDTHKLFRKLLLQRCQKEFEAKPAVEGLEELPEAERLEKELIMKRATLGHIRFVGELFKQRMLSSRIMHECISILFGDTSAPDEESLECLCKLLGTIGQSLETKAREKAEQDHIKMYYTTIKKLSGDSKLLCTRVRFMLQDLLDLRANRWVARRKETKAMTIAEVHAEVAREAKEKERSAGKAGGHARLQRSHSMNSTGSVGSNDRRRSSGGGASAAWKARATGGHVAVAPSSNGNATTVDADGWETVTGGARPKTLKHRSNSDRFPAASPSSSGAPRHPSGSARSLGGNAFASLSSSSSGRKERGRSNSSSSASSRSSSSRQREDSGRPPTPSTGKSTSSTDRSSKTEKAATAPSTTLTADAFEKKVKAILEEYVELQDLDETCTSFAELDSAVHYPLIPGKVLNIGLEKGNKEREAIATFLAGLYDREVVTSAALVDALQEVVEFAEDMEIDIPKTLPYLSEMIAPSVAAGGISLPRLVSMSEHLCYNGKAAKFIGSTLAAVVACEDEAKVQELLAEESAIAIDLTVLLAEANRTEEALQSFYKDYSLEFLL